MLLNNKVIASDVEKLLKAIKVNHPSLAHRLEGVKETTLYPRDVMLKIISNMMKNQINDAFELTFCFHWYDGRDKELLNDLLSMGCDHEGHDFEKKLKIFAESEQFNGELNPAWVIKKSFNSLTSNQLWRHYEHKVSDATEKNELALHGLVCKKLDLLQTMLDRGEMKLDDLIPWPTRIYECRFNELENYYYAPDVVEGLDKMVWNHLREKKPEISLDFIRMSEENALKMPLVYSFVNQLKLERTLSKTLKPALDRIKPTLKPGRF